MNSRLPALMKDSCDFLFGDLVRVQGPEPSTAFTFAITSEAVVSAVLQRHRNALFVGCFNGSAAVPLVVMPARETWLQKLLTLEWPVLEHLRGMQGVDDATMNKFRLGDKQFLNVHIPSRGSAGVGGHGRIPEGPSGRPGAQRVGGLSDPGFAEAAWPGQGFTPR